MKTCDYHDPDLPLAERVACLLAQMTLEEKVAQLYGLRDEGVLWGKDGRFSPTKARHALQHGAGRIGLNLPAKAAPRDFARDANAVQRFLLEETRLGIPANLLGEGLHGFMATGATVFPQALALGSTWDPALLEQVMGVTAREMRAWGVQHSLSPVLDLARDPRWGRTEECFGEDPYHVAQMGKAAVLGLQGRGETIDADHVIATGKHFAGHGQPEGGRNIAPANFPERVLRETHLFPFEVAVREAGLQCIMACYNEIDGIPAHANRWLLTNLLRGEWGFEGFVIGDFKGVDELVSVHHVAEDKADAAAQAVTAGVDQELNMPDACFSRLVGLVQVGVVDEAVIDTAVSRVLRAKFRAGLFEHPYVDETAVLARTNTPEARALAQEAAEKALILLKNDNDTLPFAPDAIRRLAVIGPNAAEVHYGGYSVEPRQGVSVLAGIQAYGNGRFQTLYAPGCKISTQVGSFWDHENATLNDPLDDARLMAEAVIVAQQADAVLLVLGGNESTCREAWAEDHLGDRADLELLGQQNELAASILALGKPTAALLINGRPLAIDQLAATVPAILQGWYLGQETGHAVARVLFGEVNPGGKLPITMPRSAGHLPAYYNQKPSHFRHYLLAENGPLYSFGHGLSYTTFAYGTLQLSRSEMRADETVWASVAVTNTGHRAGDEVVQLYVRDEVSSVTRPLLELRGFQRIALVPGETQMVRFAINAVALQFYNRDMVRVVEPGDFTIMVGASATDIRGRQTLKVTA